MLEKQEAISQGGNTFYEFLKKQNTALGILLERLTPEVLCHLLSFLSVRFVSSNLVRVSKFWYNFCNNDTAHGLWSVYSYPNQTLHHNDRAKFIKRELQREFNSNAYWRFCLLLFNWPTLLNSHFTCPYAELHPHLKISSHTQVIHIGNANGNTSARTRYGFSVANTEFAPSSGFIEFKVEQKSDRWNIGIGLAEESFLEMPKRFIGMHNNSWSYSSDGKVRYQIANKEAKQIDLNFEEYTTGDTIGLFVDLSANAVTFFKNGHSIYTLTNVASNNTLNNSSDAQKGVIYPTVTLHAVGDSVRMCTEKITLTPFKMLELVYRADIAMKQKELQNQLRAKLNRLNIVKEEYARKKQKQQVTKK